MSIGTPLSTTRSLPRRSEIDAIAATSSYDSPSWPRGILAYTDGSSATDAVVRAACALAHHAGAKVELLTVFWPSIPLPPLADRVGTARCEDTDRSAVAALLRSVRRQRRACVPEPAHCPVCVAVADPVTAIVRRATLTAADLVLTSIGSEDLARRVHSVDVPGLASRYLDAPLLAVSPSATMPAQRAVFVSRRLDISPAALRATLRCMVERAVLWVVLPSAALDGDTRRRRATPMLVDAPAALGARIRAIAREVSRPADVHVVRATSDAADAALALANDLRADLMATSLYGPPGVLRALLPSLADRLLSDAPCSVLVVPEDASAPATPG